MGREGAEVARLVPTIGDIRPCKRPGVVSERQRLIVEQPLGVNAVVGPGVGEVPPLEEQRRIVAEVEQRLSMIDALRDAIEAAKRRSAALRRSILERAFRGELVPRDPTDEPAEALLARIRAERAAANTPTTRRRTRTK